jgi:uncharacterized membrane protein
MDILQSVYGFVFQYFINPIQSGTGYNVVNTPVLALLFLFMVDSFQKGIKRLFISMDGFLAAFVPYVVLGGVMRALTDAGVYPQEFVFVTPGIYLLMLSLALIDAYFKLPLGWFLLAANLSAVVFKTDAVLLVAFFAVPATVIGALLFRALGVRMNYLVLLALFAHMLDASSTFIAVDFFNYGEQHVLANVFMDLAHTAAVMFPLKLVALAVIFYFFEDIKDPDTKAYLYWVVAALGIGPGIRNTLMAAMGL